MRGIIRTAFCNQLTGTWFDRALRPAVFTRGNGELLQLHDLFADRQQGLVLAAPLPLLDFVHPAQKPENNNAIN